MVEESGTAPVRSRRSWLLLDTIAKAKTGMTTAEVEREVDRAASKHPDWNMDELLSLSEWRQSGAGE